MQAFETDQDIYPISYRLNGETSVEGPLVDIIDMRSQEILASTTLTGREATKITAQLNANLRAGVYEKDFDLIKEHAKNLAQMPEAYQPLAQAADEDEPKPQTIDPVTPPVAPAPIAPLVGAPTTAL